MSTLGVTTNQSVEAWVCFLLPTMAILLFFVKLCLCTRTYWGIFLTYLALVPHLSLAVIFEPLTPNLSTHTLGISKWALNQRWHLSDETKAEPAIESSLDRHIFLYFNIHIWKIRRIELFQDSVVQHFKYGRRIKRGIMNIWTFCEGKIARYGFQFLRFRYRHWMHVDLG